MTPALLLAASLTQAAAAQPPVTLKQCVEWAKAASEDLKSKAEDIRQAEARARAALGGAFPRLDWDFSDTYQDPKGVNQLNAQGFGGFVERQQTESRFVAHQALFGGFREFSAFAGFKHERERNALRLRRAGDDLFERTADTFYTVLAYESGRDNTSEGLSLARDRVKELQGFRRLGKTRASEVYTAQAHAAALEASLRQSEAAIAAAREDLSFLTGHDLSTAPLADAIAAPPPVPPLDEIMAKAKERSDLRAQREDLAARGLQVRYERGAYWPSLDLTGDYYTKRATFLEAIKWDVRLDLRVPIYQGGSVDAHVDQAKAAARQSKLLLDEMERRVLHDVRKTHKDLSSAVEEARAQEAAADAAQKSYDTQQDDYRLGLVTNLDVLEALDLLQAQRSARDAARLKAKRLFLDLAALVENLP